MEADVVEACVRNAETQGCEAVYLVDNDSPDDTVGQATGAGAIAARSFTTDHYDEQLRMKLMNDVVAEKSATSGADFVWWLWLDADEFAHGSAGRTLREQLAGLDRRFRIVGTRYFNHYPVAAPHYVSGRHPIDYQPMCEELDLNICRLRHRKHPLQRWDRHGAPIECGPGFHKAQSAEQPLLEPTDSAFLHHFPFREEAVSRARLDALCHGTGRDSRARDDDPATAHMLPRYRSLEAVYAGRWEEVENFMPGRERFGVELHDWSELVDPADRRVARWYRSAERA
jgi:hypothetical protein